MSDRPPPRPLKPAHLSPALPEKAKKKAFSPTTSHNQDQDDGYQIMSACPDIELEGEPISLEKLTQERYNDFPINVVVADSLYGVCEDRTLMQGEPLTLHFLKSTKVGVLKSANGMEYMVPWNSAFQFSTVYDPINQPMESLKGFTFHSAVDLMAIDDLPQLVCVTSNYDGGHPKNSVRAGEVLAKLETILDSESKTKWLKCISIESGHKKQLSSKCVGKFSTKPSLLKRYLSEIVSYLQLPTKIMFQQSRFPQYKLPPQFINAFFTLTEQATHLTVIASGHVSTGSYGILRQRQNQVQRLIEISLEADVDVQITKTPPRELETLVQSSKHTYDTFEPSFVERMVINTSPITNQVQLELYRAVRIDCWKEGIEVVQPGVRRESQPTPRATESSADAAYSYPWVTFPGPQTQKAPSRSAPATKPKPTRAHHSPMIPPTLKSPPVQNEDDDDDYLPVGDYSAEDEEYVNPIEIQDIQETTLKATDTDIAKVTSSLSIQDKALEEFSCAEVQVLLDILGLSAYKSVFAKECIDGKLLLECDDAMLEYELNVNKSIHRLKLMRIISGKQSLQEIWN